MKISFLDFWPMFKPESSFFWNLIKTSFSYAQIVPPEQADVIFYSCFGDSNKQFVNTKKIFFTGENRRPNFNNCNYSISFDFESYNQRNVRMPLWYIFIDWFDTKTSDMPFWLVPFNYLNNTNEFTKTSKTNFCSAVFSAVKPNRVEFVEKISSYKSIEGYGKYFNKRLPNWERGKLDVFKHSKFIMCFENTAYPGYFTEKLFHAKLTGGLPLYFSDKTFDRDFNKNCCINLIDYENMDHFIETIKDLDSNNKKYLEIVNEPLFNKLPNLDEIKHAIFKILV